MTIGETRLRPAQFQADPPNLLRLAGLAFVVGSLAAFAYILLPARPMIAEWEFTAMTQLVDNAFLPLLGIVLVLHGRTQSVTPGELLAFRALVVLAMALGLLFLALIPLAVTDSQRVEAALEQQLGQGDNNEEIRMGKVEKQLKQASTLEELRVLGIMLNLKPAPANMSRSPSEEVEALRKRLREQVAHTHSERSRRSLEQREAVRARVGKDGVKIIGIALLAAVFYFSVGFRSLGLFQPHCTDAPK